MLLRPVDVAHDADHGRRHLVVLRFGDVELTANLDEPPAAGTVVVSLPQLPAGFGGAGDETVQLRWREADGVVTAAGRAGEAAAGGRLAIELDQLSAPRDERLSRRVAVKVPAQLVVPGDAGEPVATRTRNVSIGGLAVEPVAVPLVAGDRVVVAIDPRGAGVLAGAAVVAPGGGEEALRLRFDEMSGAQQDRLVALINREELRCTLR